MTSDEPQRDLPSDVPSEYADTYRQAYERALREHGAAPEPSREDGARRSLWPLILLALVVVVVLVGGAYGVGRLVSGSPEPASDGSPAAASTRPAAAPSASPSASASATPTARSAPAGPYRGTVSDVRPAGAQARCTAKAGVDSAGARVTYGAGNVVDGNTESAWRCDGRGIGQELTIALPPGTRVAEVGLIPGYAKTDPESGEDRYAENNRITEVKWIFADGTAIAQRFDGAAGDRSLRTMRVPLTVTDSLTVRVVSTVKGKRNTTMISEVRVASGR